MKKADKSYWAGVGVTMVFMIVGLNLLSQYYLIGSTIILLGFVAGALVNIYLARKGD